MNMTYFLGANTGHGFVSLYDGFCRDEGDFLHLIKAGPGGGKSSFMRAICESAQARSMDVHRVLCSGDPKSLDAVYITQLKTGFVDATAPHVVEPGIVGYNCDYVNLSEFCASADDSELELLTEQYRASYGKAYACLGAALSLSSVKSLEDSAIDEAHEYAVRMMRRLFSRHRIKESPGREKRLFMSCISGGGEMPLSAPLLALCKQIYAVDDRFGLDVAFLTAVKDEALSCGADIITALSPLDACSPAAVIIPALDTGFAAMSLVKDIKGLPRIKLDRFVGSEARYEIKRRSKLKNGLMDEAALFLKDAGAKHDELEAHYRPYIDFSALSRFTDETVSRLFT